MSFDDLYAFFSSLKTEGSWDRRWEEVANWRERPDDPAARRGRALEFVALADEVRCRSRRKALRDLVTQEGVVTIERYMLAEEEFYLAEYEASQGVVSKEEYETKRRALVRMLGLFDRNLYEAKP